MTQQNAQDAALNIPATLNEQERQEAFDEEVAKALRAMPGLGAKLAAAASAGKRSRLPLPPQAHEQDERE